MKKHNTNYVSTKRRRSLRRNMPLAEHIVWAHLRNKRLKGYRFRRQYSIGHYIADFYCHQAKLVIEIDGDSHYYPGAAEYDDKRTAYIEYSGIRVLRFTNQDVYESLENVLDIIGEALG